MPDPPSFEPPAPLWYAVIDGPVLVSAVLAGSPRVPRPWRRAARLLVGVTLAAHVVEVAVALVLVRRRRLSPGPAGRRAVLHTAVVGLPALVRLARA